MYYLIVLTAVLMFGVQFYLSQDFRRQCGDSVAVSMILSAGSALVGLPMLWLICGKVPTATAFTLLMSVITAVNGMMCTFCSLRSLGKINLSLYSLFSMLGGMVLPFAAGILWYDEDITVGKIVCLIIIVFALILPLKKENVQGGGIYYIGIFFFNGMSGVLSKMYEAAQIAKTSAAEYSFYSALFTLIISVAVLLFVPRERVRFTVRGLADLVGNGLLNRGANYLLLISLVHLPASVQYPLVTGGVIIVSTLLSFLTKDKPGRQEVIAVALSFIAILFLTF